MQRVLDVFTFMEVMPFMSGNFSQAKDFCKRVKQVFINEMGGEDSPANR